MNILPKKRWHVRTKDNIARVRRDEALAAEEEKKKQMRIEIADREARTEALRKKARQQYGVQVEPESESKSTETQPQESSHVNLFYELDQNEVVSNKANKDYEEEKKQEKEKYEKQIGYLTYLGQDTNEMTGEVSWYNKPREELRDKQEEISKKQKTFEDPLEDIRRYLGCAGIKKINEAVKTEKKATSESVTRKRRLSDSSSSHKKHKKEKKSKHKKKKKKHKSKYSSESDDSEVEVKKESKVDIERLRAERIRREKEERKRADEVIARLNGVAVKKEEPEPEITQRYNSQFNPHIAKQNYNNR